MPGTTHSSELPGSNGFVGGTRSYVVETISEVHVERARTRQSMLTKPPGSLGRLEDIACQVAGIQHTDRPRIENKWVVVAAGDHGVVEAGVSAYPQAVTAQMVANFLAGGAAVNALARQAGARVKIVDAGVAHPIPGDTSELVDFKITSGTRNFTLGSAMSVEQVMNTLIRGGELAAELSGDGADLIAVGEMGIGNTTAASTITAVMLGESPGTVTGLGTGIDETARLKKVSVVERAIVVNQPDRTDPIGVLMSLGGYEIALLVGMILKAAEERILIVLDGFISTSAALISAAIAPEVAQYMLASHRSVEPGHILALEHLGLKALIDLEMRLGEASGAVLSIPIIESAVRVHNEMATFEEAAVSGSEVGGNAEPVTH